MQIYEIDIKPVSDFATPIQGDCLFGQLCWQIAQDPNLAGNINDLLADYSTDPFVVVSDPVIIFEQQKKREYLFKRPLYPPAEKGFESLNFYEQKQLFTERKRRKGCKWVIGSKEKCIEPANANSPVNVEDIISRYGLAEDWQQEISSFQSHNSVDRLTGTTGTDSSFAPFSQQLISWHPDIKLTLFVGISENFSIESLKTALKRIGATGYGADASTGKGQFRLTGHCNAISLKDYGAKDPDSLYTLSSSLPDFSDFDSIFFESFVRFGKHGNHLAKSDYPFKQPVLKAAAGAILKPSKDRWPAKKFIGKVITNLSKHSETVEQGYSLYIPVSTGE
jgi:CRISPR-associated protein Csm4